MCRCSIQSIFGALVRSDSMASQEAWPAFARKVQTRPLAVGPGRRDDGAMVRLLLEFAFNTPMYSEIFLVDIGSTRLKAARYSVEAGVHDIVSQDSPLQAEVVDARALLDCIAQIADQQFKGVVPSAIAITGATRTHVLTGHDGQALSAVVKLDDARGAEFEERLRQAYGDDGHLGMGAFQPLARLLDCQARQPALYAQVAWQLELKDWLNLQLTGIAATDPVCRARMLPSGANLAAIATRLGLRPSLLPDVVPAASVLGRVSSQGDRRLARLQGVPVVQCGFDAWCASFGMGCVADQQTYNVTGTTEVFGSFRKDIRQVPGVSCLQWMPDLYHLGGPCQTGLATLAWFGRTFLNDDNPASVMDCAALAKPDLPLCLPFVSGERMPFWKPDLAAQFLEVRSQHGLPELARALLDGLLVFQRYLLSLLSPTAAGLHLSGGGASMDGWAQLKADAFALPVITSTVAEPGLLGAAICALTALKVYPEMGMAQAALTTSGIVTLSNLAETQRLLAVEQRLLPHLMKLAAP